MSRRQTLRSPLRKSPWGWVQFLGFQRGNNMLIGLKRKFKLFQGIVQNVGEYLGVALVADIAGKIPAGQPILDRHKGGIFAVGHGGDTLDKKGMAGIEVDTVIRILPALRHDRPGL